MELKTPKGTRDFPPEEKIARDRIATVLKEVFELYGFSPFETPMIELYDVLASKYAGGAEILQETFRLTDQGSRDLGLRYDLTVPLARFVAMNPRMKMPFKRYHVGEVFRDGPVNLGRYRQFTQCDVDTVGAAPLKADAELLALAQRVFNKLGLGAAIKINNRKLLAEVTGACGIPGEKSEDVILAIDKLDKMGKEVVVKELEGKGIGAKSVGRLLSFIEMKGGNNEKIRQLKKAIPDSEGLRELEEVIGYCDAIKVEIVLDVSLARGLSYYTGTIIEVVLSDSRVKSSVCGGGRYDRMIGQFIGKGGIPAVGISFGLDRIYDALMEKKGAKARTVTQLLIVPIGEYGKAAEIAEEMRSQGIAAEIDLLDRGPSKNLQYANSLGIPFVAFIGEDELKQRKMNLKSMKTGREIMCSAKEAAQEILRKE